jgi:hypothetical protein
MQLPCLWDCGGATMRGTFITTHRSPHLNTPVASNLFEHTVERERPGIFPQLRRGRQN